MGNGQPFPFFMRNYALMAIERLSGLSGKEYAEAFVRLKMEFFQAFQRGLITSTVHGADFFTNVILYGRNPASWLDQFPDKNLELEKNFVRILEVNR